MFIHIEQVVAISLWLLVAAWVKTTSLYVFSGKKAARTHPSGQSRRLKETGQEAGKATGQMGYMF